MFMRNLEYASYGSSAIFMTDDFDKAESKFQEVAMKVGVGLAASNATGTAAL
jgi:hypothetical protein